MRKKIFILISIFTLFLTPNIVKAASANVQISAPSSVYVGENVTISVTISSSVSLGSWEYSIYYDDSKLVFDSPNQSQLVADCVRGGGQTSTTYSWTFKATSAGSASFGVSAIDVWALDSDENGNDIKLSANKPSTSINVVKPSSGGGNSGGGNYPTTKYKYSDDNNLSSLNIEGFDIDFDSSVTEYSITVPSDTKKVKVGASANDGKASVDGIGDYDVKEGSNEIDVVVTAENGDKKTYKITVVVKELDPIEVELDGKKYNVVRKSDKLPKVNSTYKQSTILIKGESVPCYHSDITDIYLIGLMNDKGDIVLYQYDASKDKFNSYNEINVSGLFISLINTNDVPSGYKKGKIKIGDKEYEGFLKDNSYSLLYGINLETGEKNYYSYDSSEGTLQKFLDVKLENKFNSYIIYGLIGLCVFEFIMIIVSVISKNKQLKKVLRSKLDTHTEYEKSFDSVSDELNNDEENKSDDLVDECLSSSDLYRNSEMNDSEIDDSTVDDSYNDETGYDDSELSESVESFDDRNESVQDDDEDNLGHTALISRDLNNVFDDSKTKKKKKKKKRSKDDDDEMFEF